MSEVNILQTLAKETIKELKNLPKPIVRVCGPLTTGGFGYDRNAHRLELAEDILEKKGLTVFRFSESEKEIKGKGYRHEEIMENWHESILSSDLIAETYFLPGWQDSKGATIERDLAEKYKIEIKEFPEEWFDEKEF